MFVRDHITCVSLLQAEFPLMMARGLAVVNGIVIPVVNHNAFLNRAEIEILRAGLERVRGVVTV